MLSLEQTKNGCGSDRIVEAEGAEISSLSGAGRNQGGVGKPGGFTNTNDDPRAGGAVVLPGGITNTSLIGEGPHPNPLPEGEGTEAGDEADYIPRVRSPGPYSRGGRPTVLTPPVKEEICKLLSIGLSRRQAAAWLAIDHSVISRLAAKDEDFARSITRAEELADVQPRMVLAAAARKNWRAAAWLLNNRWVMPRVITEEEKDRNFEESLADKRREMDYERRLKIMEEEAKEAEEERIREKEAAWDRAMEAKERAERKERRRRKAERLQKQAEQGS